LSLERQAFSRSDRLSMAQQF